jgi:PAS domain S-box-containing protein
MKVPSDVPGDEPPIRRGEAPDGRAHGVFAGLGETEQRLRSAVRFAPFPMMLHAEDGQVLEVSRAWTEVTGYALEHIPTIEAWTRNAYGDRWRDVRALIASIYTRDVPLTGSDFAIRTRSGLPRTLFFAAAPLGRHGGRLLAASMALDVTARRRAEQARAATERRYRELVELAPDAVYVNRGNRIVLVNGAMLQLFGATARTQLLGRSPFELFHPDAHATIRDRAAALLAGRREETRGEHRIIRLDGTTRYVDVAAAPFEDDEGPAIQVNLRDITGLKEAQRLADERLAQLERMNAELARANAQLEHANAQLRDEDRRKSEFLAVLSHELRNPLAPIRNSIVLLDRAPPGSAPAARARAVLQRQTEHLARLVDDLLDVTRVARGKVQLDRARLDLREVVRQTCEDNHSLLDQARIHLQLDEPSAPVWVDADATRIAQVVGNLLQNAAKFTPAGGRVEVAVARRGELAAFTVRDSGVGIEPGDVDRLFEPFSQARQDLARTRGGLGLGLALARGLVQLHGGRITASSAGRGKGTAFEVTLPAAAAGHDASGPPARSAAAARSRLVVVIEDNRDAAQSLADLLELGGHRVHVVHDGRAGIALARALRPHLVLCDLGLPDVDGYEVARTLRGDEALRSTRLVAVSGYTQAPDQRRALEAGFDAHVPKPPSIEILVSLLERDP